MTTLQQKDLVDFSGEPVFYQSPLNKKVLYTKGIRHVIDAGEANWLITDIIAWMKSKKFQKAVEEDERFQYVVSWKLEVFEDRSARLTARADHESEAFITQDYRQTNFPLQEIEIWQSANGEHEVLYLPSER